MLSADGDVSDLFRKIQVIRRQRDGHDWRSKLTVIKFNALAIAAIYLARMNRRAIKRTIVAV